MWPNQFIAEITIHLHSCPQLHIILKKQNDNSGAFRAIATEKCMSHQMAKSVQDRVYCSCTFN